MNKRVHPESGMTPKVKWNAIKKHISKGTQNKQMFHIHAIALKETEI
jgi:hypothetical protein